MDSPVLPDTLFAASKAIGAGAITAVELVERAISRIDRLDGRIQAWALVDADGARHTAVLLDRELAAGRSRGALHGMPLGIKDIIDVAGWPTRCGAWAEDIPAATCDAPVVARLRAAGAILLGKTATCPFACFDPAPTRNPWNPARTPGGSSSGSAAAVASGMCLGALGTQTGGSITRPASYCGVAGCKPTIGLIPGDGVMPVSGHLDHVGPIAACVADLAILMVALVPDVHPLPHVAGSPPALANLRGELFERAEPPVAQVYGQALARLSDAGARIEDGSVRCDWDAVLAWHRTIMAVDAAAVHETSFAASPDRYGPQVTALIEEGQNTSRTAYLEALAQQRRLRDESSDWMPNGAVFVTPATVDTAPEISSTGRPWFNAPWSFLGVPTISLPCGIAADGLPVALQLVGRAGGERALFAAALWCEQALGFAQRANL